MAPNKINFGSLLPAPAKAIPTTLIYANGSCQNLCAYILDLWLASLNCILKASLTSLIGEFILFQSSPNHGARRSQHRGSRRRSRRERCGSPAKSVHEPAGVMNRFCQVNPLDGRREAPPSKRMESAAMAWREASTPSYCSPAADAIRKTTKKVMNYRKTTINLKRHGFCGQVQQMVGRRSQLQRRSIKPRNHRWV